MIIDHPYSELVFQNGFYMRDFQKKKNIKLNSTNEKQYKSSSRKLYFAKQK